MSAEQDMPCSRFPQGIKHSDQLRELGHTIHPLIPSLFAFNLPNHPMKDLSEFQLKMPMFESHQRQTLKTAPFLLHIVD